MRQFEQIGDDRSRLKGPERVGHYVWKLSHDTEQFDGV
jgi:hypothetical protein